MYSTKYGRKIKSNMKQKKRTFKVGDTIYYMTPDGVEYDTIMDIDGQNLIMSDYGIVQKRNCLDNNDPRIKNAKPTTFCPPPEDMLKQEEEMLRKQGLL